MKTERLAMFDSMEIKGDYKGNSKTAKLPEEFMLIAYGLNKYTRNGKYGEFKFLPDDADTVINEFKSRDRDLVIDYEHQTLTGKEAPAAGWISELLKTPRGLMAKVKYWTGKGGEHLLKGEYRYISPVICFSRRARSVSAIHSVALTNHPAMHGNPAIAANDTLFVADDEAAKKQPSRSAEYESINHNNTLKAKGKNMKQIISMLGLTPMADAGDEKQIEAVKKEVDKLVSIREEHGSMLELADSENFEQFKEKMTTMVPLEEKEKLITEIQERDAEKAVGEAFADRKITAHNKPWAVKFAMNDLRAFREWAENAPPAIPSNQDIEQEPAANSSEGSLSEAQIKILRNLGLSEEQIKALKENA